jgi:hypothetical protein
MVGSMPSPALTAWSTSSAAALSQLQAHRAADGARALQLHYAYVLLLCAHFQAYCRGLHTDAAQLLVERIDPGIAAVVDANLTFARQLDRGNAQPSALGADFNRLGLKFWAVVEAVDTRNAARQRKQRRGRDVFISSGDGRNEKSALLC